MADYPTFTLDTKYGPFTVTVLDPTPSEEEQRRNGVHAREERLFIISGKATINRVPLRVDASFTRYPQRDPETGQPVVPHAWYLRYAGYGVVRTDRRNEIPEGVRKAVTQDLADAAFALVTQEHIRAARVARLTDDADRKRQEAESLTQRAAEAMREADELWYRAQRLLHLGSET